LIPATKEPPARPEWRSAAGAKGARSRWGPQRVVRLNELDPITADIIRAILAARANAAPGTE
jgi:hypothetical protein